MAGYIGSRASVVSSGAERKKTFAITTTTTVLTGLSYTPTFVHLFHNGVRLVDGTDYTATDGTSITLTSAAESGDEVVVISYASFQVADAYTKAEADAEFVSDPNGAVTVDGSGNVGIGISPLTALHVAGVGRFTSGNENLNTYHNGTVGYIETNGNASTPIGFANGGLERMRIDGSGRVTMPYQPAFSIYGNTDPNWYNDVIYIGHVGSSASADDTNVGSHFSYSTGRFTAPVSGRYFFSWSVTSNDSNSHFVDIHKNDTRVGGHTLLYNAYATSTSNVIILNLSANDYVDARRRAAGYSFYATNFSGYLIG